MNNMRINRKVQEYLLRTVAYATLKKTKHKSVTV